MLKGKRVLFVAPKFYIYHQEILKELKSMGADVTFLPEIEHTIGSRIAAKISSRYYHKKVVIPHQRRVDAVAKANPFDFVFIIRGGYFDSHFIESLRAHCSDAHFILYQWDSIRQNDYRDLIPCFDEVSTFDIEDSRALQIDYRPLFYIPQYANLTKTVSRVKENDLCFVGAFHSDRLAVVKFFAQHLKANGRRFHCHMYITKMALLARLLTGKIQLKDINYFKTSPLDVASVADLYQRSSAVLDIELNIQSGLSIRTFEVLGGSTKLVTTNRYIKEHSFYNPDIIDVIDRNQLAYNDRFFDRDASEVEFGMEHYSLREWLANIFGKPNCN